MLQENPSTEGGVGVLSTGVAEHPKMLVNSSVPILSFGGVQTVQGCPRPSHVSHVSSA